jgi:hypothetical protein
MVVELACWRRRAGMIEDIPTCAAGPYALELAGRCELAAGAWADLGCPYEAALALGQADDEGALRQALDELQGMGAAPAAVIVTGRNSQIAEQLVMSPRTVDHDISAILRKLGVSSRGQAAAAAAKLEVERKDR